MKIQGRKKVFHSVTVKLLFWVKWARPDTIYGDVFCTRVQSAMVQDMRKTER